MKSITTVTVSNRVQHVTVRAWKVTSDIKTSKIIDYRLILFDDKTIEKIVLPLSHWESFIIFLAESFALAEAEAEGKNSKIKITLTVEKS
jgi:hypothetical protein